MERKKKKHSQIDDYNQKIGMMIVEVVAEQLARF